MNMWTPRQKIAKYIEKNLRGFKFEGGGVQIENVKGCPREGSLRLWGWGGEGETIKCRTR